MTIARLPRSITFTAVNESLNLDNAQRVVGMSFQGTGLTVGQRLLVTDSYTPGSGNVLADYAMAATAVDNADVWGSKPPQRVQGLAVANNTIAGTWVLTVFVL